MMTAKMLATMKMTKGDKGEKNSLGFTVGVHAKTAFGCLFFACYFFD